MRFRIFTDRGRAGNRSRPARFRADDMTRIRPHSHSALRRSLLPALLVLWGIGIAGAAAADDEVLQRMRAERRAHSRDLQLLKNDGPARFGLLVIPVEFQDTRFGDDWTPQQDLAPRLDGAGSATLRNYFDVASRGRLDLAVTLAPVVRLAGDRQDYSGIGYTHSLHSRLLAEEAIEALDDLGFEFRRLDLDGPDGKPASGDDDGLVDGVLILHAGIGLENDLVEGRIAALQYFLDEPYLADGVGISFFALASARSGLGIWAHETAHLLGLEDRYDPRLTVEAGAEVLSRGGLGRFSLMSAGAWGTGGGVSPALPDAYSCLQLGWLAPRVLDWRSDTTQTLLPTLTSGEAGLIWTDGRIGTEYFLLECRSPQLAAPFDGGVYEQRLIVYHVDESLPEETVIPDSGTGHLRVRLVEGDGDTSLADGDDSGDIEDLFGQIHTQFGPSTSPSSDGYAGPSGVSLQEIAPSSGGVRFVAGAVVGYEVAVALQAGAESLALEIREQGLPLQDVSVRLEILEGTEHGTFTGGTTTRLVACEESDPGIWSPTEVVVWEPAADLPVGATTTFGVTVLAEGWQSERFERAWVWTVGGTALDFEQVWPGDWVETRPGFNRKTGWFRWPGSIGLTAGGTAVLAAVDTIFADGSDWPAVRYNNQGEAVLTSGPLPDGLTAVRLVHRIEGEILAGSTALDGGLLRWVAPDGSTVAADPVDGWEATIAPDAYSRLAGQRIWVGAPAATPAERPVWQVDLVPLPQGAAGPWRLQLVFASDASAYRKGWFVADLAAWSGELPAAAFDASWDGAGLAWFDPITGAGAGTYRIEEYDAVDQAWQELLDGSGVAELDGRRRVDRAAVLAALGGSPNDRRLVRVVGTSSWGEIASRPIEIYPDGGPVAIGGLGMPWPNPSADGSVRFVAEVPSGQTREVTVYDLRGRRIRSWRLPAGQHVLLWNALDSGGRRAAAGTYLLRMEAQEGHLTRKVVLVH